MAEEKRQKREARRKRREEGKFLKDGPIAADLDSPIAFLFPGQGSQAIGMLNETKDIPEVRAMLDTAKRILGYDLLAVCTEGVHVCKHRQENVRVAASRAESIFG